LHIEEIVYYFSATRSNIVIFEDLDRFDKPEIFIKLKEINKLINDSNEVGQRVCFIYALKDDVFNGSNRTKFFDAIIPIIPITNSVNSYPRLKKLLEDSDLLFGLRDEFLRDVAVFIEDMRMLKNIVTEYSIYKQTLKSSIQQPELYRLFSFIIYKNIYCADFSKLQANQGVLADFFKNKHKLQQSFVGNTQIEIETLESEIKAIEGEKLRSIEEVNAVFTIALLNELDNNSVYLLNGMSLSNFIAHDVFHKAWVSDSLINYNTSHYNRAQSAKKLSDYSDIISPSYSLRKQYLEDRANNSTATLNQQIKTLKSKAKHCQKSSVKELTKLVSRDELYSHLLEGENSEQPSKKVDYTLLIHLIEKGYVDEMYHVYISHFLEGHVTKGDMNFVLKVKSNQPFDCEAPLIEKKEIFKYLNSDDYNNEAVFNYDLINHLIGEGETEHLKMIVSMVKSDSSVLDAKAIFESLKFIDDKKAWLKEIVTEWQSIWPDIINTGTLNTVEKNEFLVTLLANLYGAFENTPLPMKEEYIPTVKKYIDEISHLSTLMPESDDEYTNVIDGLKFLKIQLMDFEAGESNGQFITDIIHCNLFLPSIGNYKHLASIISNKPIDDIEMSLSAFQSLEDVSMSNQIDCNINNFVSNVLFNDSFIIGEESSSLYLLNHSHLSKDLKEELIDKEDFVITNLLDIDDKHFWPQLLKRNKLKVSWKNIQSLLIENKLYAAAIDYLSAEYVYSILTSKEEVEHVHILDKQLDSFVNILISSDFDIKVFKIYCPLFKDLILAVHLSDLETDQVSVLIDYKYVIFTEESYAAIEDYHPSLLINFIENNFYNVFHSKVYSGLTFTEQELLQLLTSDVIDSDLKVVASSKLEDQTASISQAFFEVYFEIFISAPTEIPKHLLRLLLSLKLAILSKKVILLTSQIKYISKELTFEFLGSFGEQYSRLFRTQSHCRLDNNKENRALAEALVEQGYFSMSKISDYVDTIRLNKRGK
jgi:hypothetical protein